MRELERETCQETTASQVRGTNITTDSTLSDSRKWNLDYYIKFVLLAIAAICAALHVKWASRSSRSILTEAPAPVFFAYTFVNAYIILEYRTWYRTSKMTKQLFGLIGGFVFCAAGVLEIYDLAALSDSSYADKPELGTLRTEDQLFRTPIENSSLKFLTSAAFLSLTESALYFANTFIVSF